MIHPPPPTQDLSMSIRREPPAGFRGGSKSSKKKIASSRQLESVWIRRRSQWVALTQFHGETKVPKHSRTLVKTTHAAESTSLRSGRNTQRVPNSPIFTQRA